MSDTIQYLYDTRNEKKKQLQISADRVFYPKAWEIWNVEMGQNLGNEQNGWKNFRRPFLLLKKVWNLFFWLPLTSKSKIDFWHFPIVATCMTDEKDRSSDSKVCLWQAKLLDPKRFIKQIGRVSAIEFQEIKKIIREMYL